jgi:hypothetical protein
MITVFFIWYILYAVLECDPENAPSWGVEALNSTRTHASCTNGVRTMMVISGREKLG